MTPRQKAIEELQKQIKLGRERLGPDGVRQLEKLAKGIQKPKPAAPSTVPYDKKAAAKALEIFLKNHSNAKDFEKKLLEFLKKSSH